MPDPKLGWSSEGDLGCSKMACAMAWHTSFFLYPCFGRNLAFICSNPSDPYVLFLEPRFCFISYVQPL